MYRRVGTKFFKAVITAIDTTVFTEKKFGNLIEKYLKFTRKCL